MKIHFFLVGLQSAKTDIDKKLPRIIKRYPDSKVEKKMLSDYPYIKIPNIASNVSFHKFNDHKSESPINIDAYTFSSMSYTLFDISFELKDELLDAFMIINDYGEAFFKESTVMINGEVRSFAVIITEYIVPMIKPSEQMELSKEFRKNKNLKLNEKLDIYNERLGIKPYLIEGISGNLSVTPQTTFFILEDFNNQLNISDSRIESMVQDDKIYVDNSRALYICKHKEYFKDLWEFHLIQSMHLSQLSMSISLTESFLSTINKRGNDVRENIDSDNQNAYYWRKLKKKIEIMDLNFLEFHSDAIILCNHNPNINWGTCFSINDKPYKKIQERIKDKTQLLKESLHEVKYSIGNLSTPSHTHDELILQKETEKVNDRILMLSFIAMAVSAINMMRTNDIEPLFKALSGLGIISLPILYYFIRSIQRKISKKTNRNSELKRQINNKNKQLKREKKQIENLKHHDMPEDFKKELIAFRNQFIKDEEKDIQRLKNKIK